MARYEHPQYKDIESIMVRLDPISQCIDYQMEKIPEKMYWRGIENHRKIRETAIKMLEYSDTILRAFDKDYEPIITHGEVIHTENLTSEQSRDKEETALIAPHIINSPKNIMGRYYSTTFVASQSDYQGDAVMQQIAKTFYKWFYERYNSSSVSNSKYALCYNCYSIIKFIDCFIIAAGFYLSKGSIDQFNAIVMKWIIDRQQQQTTESFPTDLYDLTYDIDTTAQSVITPQAIYIEKQLKSIVYTSSFLPENRDSIRKIALKHRLDGIVSEGDNIVSLSSK